MRRIVAIVTTIISIYIYGMNTFMIVSMLVPMFVPMLVPMLVPMFVPMLVPMPVITITAIIYVNLYIWINLGWVIHKFLIVWMHRRIWETWRMAWGWTWEWTWGWTWGSRVMMVMTVVTFSSAFITTAFPRDFPINFF